MNNWIFDIFSSKDGNEKEADLTNQEKEWERKVDSNDWIKDAMNIDETELAREAAKKQAAEEDAAGVTEPFDEVGMIMAFEQGDLDNAGILRLFSELIKNGHAWSLQGSYGRAAKSLIDQGYLDEQGNILKEVDEPAAGDELQDPEMGTEREDWTASQKAKVKKIAAFTKGDTCEETIEKDYELRVKGLSDYNLAEMLSEYAAMEKGVATLSHNEYKEDAMKEVKSGRDAAEKKLLKLIGDHTLIDWKKSFKEMEDSEVKHAAEKDLYSEWKEGKMAWEEKTKFEATTEKEKVEQMEGVGKEEEKGQVGKEASKKLKCPKCGSSDSVTPAHDNKLNKCDACHYAFDNESAKEASSTIAFITKTARAYEMLIGKYVEVDAKDVNDAMAKAKQMFPDLEVEEVGKQMGDEMNRKFKLVYKKKAYLIKSGSKFFVYMTNVVPVNAPNEAQALELAKQQYPNLDKVTLNNAPDFSEVEMAEPAVSDVPLPMPQEKRKKKVHEMTQAALKAIAALNPGEMIEKKVEKLIKEKIEEAFAAAPVEDPKDFPADPLMVGEDTPEDKLLDELKVPHLEPGETPESEVKEWKDEAKKPEDKKEEPKVEDKKEDKKDEGKEASLKTADELMDDVRENDPLHGQPPMYTPRPFKEKPKEKEAAPAEAPAVPPADVPVDAPSNEREYHGWRNYESWLTSIWLDSDRDINEQILEAARSSSDIAELASRIEDIVMASQPDLGASLFADLMSNTMRNIDWSALARHYEEDMPGEAPELAEPATDVPVPGAPEASMAEIKPHASKKEVLQKVAEIDSPWKVMKNEKGEEIIARVAPVATEKKSKEKDKQHGINSQDLK